MSTQVQFRDTVAANAAMVMTASVLTARKHVILDVFASSP